MKYIIFAILIAAFPACAGYSAPLQATNQKDWQFPTANGPAVVRVVSMQSTEDGKPIYSLQIITGRTGPSVIDEATFLATVTKSMSDEGMPPTRIVALHLELKEPDVQRRLSTAAYESDEWRSANASSAGRIVVKILNSIGAYEPLNQVFRKFGLVAEVSNAEYITTISPESLGLKRNGVPDLPSSATLELVLRQVATSPRF
jgi:hypothetical protein